MRLIGKLIMLIIALSCGVYLYFLYIDYKTTANEYDVEQEKEFYVSHSSFQIANEINLTYSLPKNATNFKILIYPIVNNEIFNHQLNKFNQQEGEIEFSLLLKNAEKSIKHNYSVEKKSYSHVETGELLQAFWLNDEQTVLQSKTLEFPVSEDKILVFSLSSNQADSYLVRAYYQQRQSKIRVTQRWQRASDKRKDNLLKYHPFDTDTISQAEISSLYKNLWTSVAPILSNNSELKAVRLFEYENREELVSASRDEYSNLKTYLPKNNKYTFKLLKEGSIKLLVGPLSESEALIAKLTYKSDKAKVESRHYTKSEFESINLKPGQYELSFNQDVGFELESNTAPHFFKKPSSYTQLYKLPKNKSITYAVKSLPNIKEYYRAVFHAIGGITKANILIETFADKELLNSTTQELSFQKSDYMPFINNRENGLQIISAAIEMNLEVSSRATRVVITALDHPVSLNLSNTVSGLASIKRISTASTASYQNSWFLLKPERALEFKRDKLVDRYMNIDSNAIRPERVAQSFEKLRPQNTRRFKDVYYVNKSTIYSGNSLVNFRKLKVGSNNSIIFKDKKTNKKTIRPTLIVRNMNSADISNFSLSFSGNTLGFENTELLQEYSLPKVFANKSYELRIPKQSNKEYYINYTSVGKNLLTKRQFFKAKTITKYKFYKRKNAFENLSLHFLSNKTTAFEVKTTLYKNGKLITPQQTAATRRYIFDSHDKEISKNLLTSTECGLECFLYTPQFSPLYEDLSEGWYELHVQTPSNMQVYIDVGKTYYEKASQSIIFSDELQN